MKGTAAKALVQAEVGGQPLRLIASYLRAYPDIWHVIEKGLDTRAWIVDLKTDAVLPISRRNHAGRAITAYLYPEDEDL